MVCSRLEVCRRESIRGDTLRRQNVCLFRFYAQSGSRERGRGRDKKRRNNFFRFLNDDLFYECFRLFIHCRRCASDVLIRFMTNDFHSAFNI